VVPSLAAKTTTVALPDCKVDLNTGACVTTSEPICKPDEDFVVDGKCVIIPDVGTKVCLKGFHNDGHDKCIPNTKQQQDTLTNNSKIQETISKALSTTTTSDDNNNSRNNKNTITGYFENGTAAVKGFRNEVEDSIQAFKILKDEIRK
jgi:hypothetical protein